MATDRKPGLLRRGLRRLRRVASSDPVVDAPPTVRFVVQGAPDVTCTVEPFQTVLQAAIAQGIDLSHYCGGTCTCGTCRVRVLRGAAHLSSMEGREQMVLGYDATQAGDRLACQARVQGPVEIEVLDRY